MAVKIRTTRRVLHPTSETVRVQDAAVLSYTGKYFFDAYSSTDCIVESVTEVSLQLACRKEKRKNTRLSSVKKILYRKNTLARRPEERRDNTVTINNEP